MENATHTSVGGGHSSLSILGSWPTLLQGHSVLSRRSWQLEEDPDDWRKKKGRKENLRKEQPVSPIPVPGKIMKQVLRDSVFMSWETGTASMCSPSTRCAGPAFRSYSGASDPSAGERR